jgi:type II secretion system protein I
MHGRPGKRAEQGFTMIEVMMALLITAIAVIGIVTLYMTATKASSYSRHSTEAAVLANDKLEALRTVATPTTSSETGINEQGRTVPPGIFDRSWTVTSTTDYYNVSVQVSWEENGATRAVSVVGRRSL